MKVLTSVLCTSIILYMVDQDHSQKEEKVMSYAAEIVAKRLVEIHAAKAVLEEQYEAVKKELLALGVDEVSLDVATVKVSEGIRFTLDNKAVIEELGQSWVDDHTKITAFKQVRVTYKAVARKVA